MGKSSPRNPLWPDWFDGEKIDEVTFCHELIRNHPMKCIENRFFTPDGPVEDEAELKQLILKEIQAFIIHGLSKRVANLLESLRIIAYSAPLDIEVDCIHLKNGIYHLADGTFQESRLFCRNRLPVAYNPKAAKSERWLAFLNELLEPEDIPTLQEYLGYCLIPCTKGQKMMFLLGKGGEGKSRIGLVLKKLMGDAVSNGSIQKVETSRFARADLENRLLMVDDDLNMNALPKTNYIKSIVTAEAKMDVERKGMVNDRTFPIPSNTNSMKSKDYTNKSLQMDSNLATMEMSKSPAIESSDQTKAAKHEPLVYRVEEIAQLLAISPRAAYNLCNTTKDFRVLRIGTSIRVNKQSFDNWFAAV